MERHPENVALWDKRLIRALWVVLLVFEVAALAGFVVTMLTRPAADWAQEALHYQVLPGLGHVAVMIVFFRIYRRLRGEEARTMICWTLAVAVNYYLWIPELADKYELLSLALFLSTIYFDRRKVFFAFWLTLATTLLLIAWNYCRTGEFNPFDLIISVSILTTSLLICLAVMRKGWWLIQDLQRAAEREHQLQLRSILADQMSRRDALTGLLNHKSFHEKSDDLLRAYRPAVPLALVLLDLDNFKSINDTYGHWVGDQVLKAAAVVLRETLGPDHEVFRYGGEEFAALLIGLEPVEAVDRCETIRVALHGIAIPEFPAIHVSASIGVTIYAAGMTKDEWFIQADERLYAAKRAGKDRVVAV